MEDRFRAGGRRYYRNGAQDQSVTALQVRVFVWILSADGNGTFDRASYSDKIPSGYSLCFLAMGEHFQVLICSRPDGIGGATSYNDFFVVSG